jgi:hypothetical protein
MNRGNGKFDDFEEGDERIYFAIDPEVVARVTSMDGEYFEWRLSDLDKIDKTLNEAGGRVRAANELRCKAHYIRGQGGNFVFPLISQVPDALHKVMVSEDDILIVEGETRSRGLFGALHLVVERQARGNEDILTQAAAAHAVTSDDTNYGDTSC